MHTENGYPVIQLFGFSVEPQNARAQCVGGLRVSEFKGLRIRTLKRVCTVKPVNRLFGFSVEPQRRKDAESTRFLVFGSSVERHETANPREETRIMG
jgi:hypothetical protein